MTTYNDSLNFGYQEDIFRNGMDDRGMSYFHFLGTDDTTRE